MRKWLLSSAVVAALAPVAWADSRIFEYQATNTATADADPVPAPTVSGRALSSGNVVATVTSLGPTNVTGQTPGAFTAYRLTLSTTDNSLITAINAGGTTNGVTDTTHGFFSTKFSQLAFQVGQTITTPDEPNQNDGTQFSIDTHFLPPTTQIVASAPLAEDFNSTNLPGQPPDSGAADFGQGTVLQGTFGITAQFEATTLDLAYLVLPTGTTATFNILVTTSNNQPPANLSGTIPVPEPAAMSLLGAGGFALLTRRRRRRT